MRYMIEYPIRSDPGGGWLIPDAMAEFARLAEEVGVDAIALTDHPAPSRKWLDHGGHETLDPFTGLAFFAAATSKIRLMTYLAVVPYRNPLLLAKCMTSLDVVSGGRATFVLGAGYLRSEFGALGVEFDERNDLFDEAAEVLHAVWANDSFNYEGRGFTARGQVISPRPVQQPHPPLWLGGNSMRVRERVALWGQGWAPTIADASFASTIRTAAIDSDDALGAAVADLAARLERNGRSLDDIEVMAASSVAWQATAVEAYLERIACLESLGVGWTQLRLSAASLPEACEELRSWGEAMQRLTPRPRVAP
jgi:probable F420-dependent oxidoreductase